MITIRGVDPGLPGRTPLFSGGKSQDVRRLGSSKSSFFAFTFHVPMKRLMEEKVVNSD